MKKSLFVVLVSAACAAAALSARARAGTGREGTLISGMGNPD